jgi:hypothetical protein
MNCDRCGAKTDEVIRGEHIRPEKNIKFQICFKCDDEVFFEGELWNKGRGGRPAKYDSDEERKAARLETFKKANAKRRKK